jgi:hypothetical protein
MLNAIYGYAKTILSKLPTSIPEIHREINRKRLFVFVGVLIFLRLLYGLTTEFWFPDQDVLQIYLIGLKSFTTGDYPYFGADLVYTQTQIPGALQAFLVMFGWFILPIAEMPHITLGLLNCLSLGWLAMYISKRSPALSPYFVWSLIYLTPWSLAYCTRVINPSYVLTGAVVFFISLYELFPTTRIDFIRKRTAYFGLGFGLLWIFQLHMSWVLLLPCIAVAFLVDTREVLRLRHNSLKASFNTISLNIVFFMLGLLTTGSTLFPTLFRYGLSGKSGNQGIASVVQLNTEHIAQGFTFLTKFFAYCCFDVTRFIGGDSAERLQFLSDYWWATPATILVTVFGVTQLLLCILGLLWKKNPSKGWNTIRLSTLFFFVLMYASSWFSMKSPGGHATVLYIIPTLIYFAQLIEPFSAKRWFTPFWRVVFISAVIMYSAIAYKNFTTISIYTNRVAPQKALDTMNYKLVGERRYDK